jgi:hypothetical protein
MGRAFSFVETSRIAIKNNQLWGGAGEQQVPRLAVAFAPDCARNDRVFGGDLRDEAVGAIWEL